MNRTPSVPTRKMERVNIPEEVVADILTRFSEGTSPHIPILLGYECGLKSGEVFGVVWEDIDFENKTLTVNRQVQWHQDEERSSDEKVKSNGSKHCGNGYWYFENPKYNSFRTIDLTDRLVELLKRERDRQLKSEAAYEEYYTRYYSKYKLRFLGRANSPESINNPIGFADRITKNVYIHLTDKARNDGKRILDSLYD